MYRTVPSGNPLYRNGREGPADFSKIEANFNGYKDHICPNGDHSAQPERSGRHEGPDNADGKNRRRFDHIAPDRAVYIIDGDRYINYDFSEKKEVRKKLGELSSAHIIFLEEIFLDILHDPVNLLMRRYSFPAFRKGYRDITSPLAGVSLRDPAARVAVHFNANGITSIEYYFKGNLNKKTVFEDFAAIKGISVPTTMKTTIYVSPNVLMTVRLSEISINDQIDDKFFRKIAP
jgi:hypothetical protein